MTECVAELLVEILQPADLKTCDEIVGGAINLGADSDLSAFYLSNIIKPGDRPQVFQCDGARFIRSRPLLAMRA
jgi:hypothetical protein